MKITEISYHVQYTLPIKDFVNIKPLLGYKAELQEGDDVEECTKKLKEIVDREMKKIINDYINNMKNKKMKKQK